MPVKEKPILSPSGYTNWNVTDILTLKVSPDDPTKKALAKIWTALDTSVPPNGVTLDILMGKDSSLGLYNNDRSTGSRATENLYLQTFIPPLTNPYTYSQNSSTFWVYSRSGVFISYPTGIRVTLCLLN